MLTFEIRRNEDWRCWQLWIVGGWVRLPYTLDASLEEVEAALKVRLAAKGDREPIEVRMLPWIPYGEARPHKAVLHGPCPTCGHYGDDCTGSRTVEGNTGGAAGLPPRGPDAPWRSNQGRTK